MANITINQLPSASALTGAEEIPGMQGGGTKKITAQAIADLAGGGGGGLGTLNITTVGTLGADGVVNYYLKSFYSASATGAQQYEVSATPDIQLSGSGYSGGTPTATYIGFPTLTRAQSLTVNGFPYLETLEAPELISSEIFGTLNMTSMKNIIAPKLQSVTGYSGMQFGANQSYTLTNVSFPALTFAKLQFTQNYVGKSTITSTEFPVLSSVGIYVGNSYDLTEINLPAVTTINSWGMQVQTYNSTLTKFHLPNVVSINNYQMYFYGCYGLTDLQIGAAGVTKTYNGNNNAPYLYFQNCALSQASVDGILAMWASLDGTNGTTAVYSGQLYINGGSNAAPSQAGLDSMNILQNRGWYIARNY